MTLIGRVTEKPNESMILLSTLKNRNTTNKITTNLFSLLSKVHCLQTTFVTQNQNKILARRKQSQQTPAQGYV